jgi:transcriptional regulator with XRE-family HTH domain
LDEELKRIHSLVGQRIKTVRTEKNITSEQLAERSGLSVTYISRLENGRQSPTLSALYKLAKGLGIPFIALFSYL